MKDKKAFRTIKKAALFFLTVATLLSALSLAGCGHRLEAQGMSIVEKKTGSSYRYLSACFEPAEISKKAYGSVVISGAKQELYSIRGLDTAKWLCTEWGDVLYAGDEDVGTLETFAPTSAYLCYTGGSVSVSFAVIEGGDLEKVLSAWRDGSTVEKPIADPDETYAIKFESKQFPGLYYSMSVLVYGSDYYIYNKYDSAKCVVAPDVIQKYITDSEATDAA